MNQAPTLMQRWQRIARRIRVPLGFVAAAIFLWQLVERSPQSAPIAWSLLLTLPGLWLRAYASGYVKKNRELTITGPYAHVRNPLYVGSILIAAGFAVALMSWQFALTLAIGFALIYIPVIASEEAFLRDTFLEFEWYCARVPRLIPRLTPVRSAHGGMTGGITGEMTGATARDLTGGHKAPQRGAFSLELYRRHREYNSAIGTTLLYGSLCLAILLHSRYGR